MRINKIMRAGYQNKPDAMRKMADKLMDHPGHAKDVYYSASCADKEKMRLYKKGGLVKGDDTKKCDGKKYAMGGVAKMRHDEATSTGMPKKMKKKPIINNY